MRRAWIQGSLFHWDPKKYPKRPEQLWDKGEPDQPVDVMKALALAWASNGAEIKREMREKKAT